jgi:hypothetical protein
MQGNDWRSSSRCDVANCVQVKTGVRDVYLRDSADKGGPVLRFSTADWAAFVAAVDEFVVRRQTPA